MSDPKKTDEDKSSKVSRDNLFQIMDGIIQQLNITKKMFIIMIVTIMIIPPLAFAITFALLGPPFPFDNFRMQHENFGPHPFFGHYFGLVRFVPFLIALIWLGIGIRQWFVLSGWTKKYERYKELQKKIDEKLDYDESVDNESK